MKLPLTLGAADNRVCCCFRSHVLRVSNVTPSYFVQVKLVVITMRKMAQFCVSRVHTFFTGTGPFQESNTFSLKTHFLEINTW